MSFIYKIFLFSILHRVSFLFLAFATISASAQVGIGTTTPAPSSILEISSNDQGLLVPRMTTAQRTAINAPANSLMVFDTDVNSFYYFDTTSTSWIKVDASPKRDNYKLIKNVSDLAAELTAGGGNEYLLDANTFYEINGEITLVHSINLNNATVAGLNANEDKLYFAGGTVFKGNTGGNIKNITLKGNKTFEIEGPGITTSSSLIVQNTIINGMTGVGSISKLGLYFGNIIQYIGNANGITYSDIGNLLLNNQGWFADNQGTFETFTGTFGLIEKVSGFSTLNGTAVGMNFSTNPTVGTGVLLGHVFLGNNVANAITGYTTGSYTGYNFTNAWTVDSPGIPREGDANAAGNMYLTASTQTAFTGTGNSSRKKINGTTASTNLFRFKEDDNVNNRIRYTGSKKRYFQVNASISYESSTTIATVYILYIAKNGAIVGDTKVYGRTASSTRISSLPIVATIELEKNDFIEVWAERLSGSAQMNLRSLSLSID